MNEHEALLTDLLDPGTAAEAKRLRTVEIAQALHGSPEADRDDALDELADRIAERLLVKLSERQA